MPPTNTSPAMVTPAAIVVGRGTVGVGVVVVVVVVVVGGGGGAVVVPVVGAVWPIADGAAASSPAASTPAPKEAASSTNATPRLTPGV
jgi:hypothetical protein